MFARSGMMLMSLYVVFLLYTMPITAHGEMGGETKLTVKWGTTDGKLGFKKRTKASTDIGPKSFFVASDNDIYILDNANNRVNRYTDGKFASSIKLLSSVSPVDIAVRDGILYVLNNFSVESYDKSGKLIRIKKLSDEPSKMFYGVWRIFKLSKGVIITAPKKGSILCLSDDLRYIACENWSDIFNKYTVYDVVNDSFFVDGGDKILRIEKSGKIVNSQPDISASNPPTLFPVACWRRIISPDTVYVMDVEKSGLSIKKTKLYPMQR